jgi:hypothetical protein
MTSTIQRISRLAGVAGLAALLFLVSACKRAAPGTYATPEEAVQALNELIGSGDERRIEEMFGPGSVELFRSGDEDEDNRARVRVKELIAEKVAFEELDDTTRVAFFGEKAWPFPIPLVRAEKRWRFDTAAGREELLNRRIGYNELGVLSSLHEFVDAQKEYAAVGHDGSSPAFAQKFLSTEGKQDGLYWPTAEGEPLSPLGDLFAAAALEDVQADQPFNGYRYRMLKAQGPNAPGGEKSYLDDRGRMTRGFAAIAWPVKHGNSGVMTFIVNQHGIVFQKDLGAETEQAVAAIEAFNPDATWQPTGDSLEIVEDEGEETESPPSTEPGS